MTTVIFGGVTLSAPSPKAPILTIRSSKKILLGGEQKIYVEAYQGEAWAFTCFPRSYSEIEELINMIGTRTTLTIDTVEYCYYTISRLAPRELTPMQWEYDIEFQRTSVIGCPS